MRQKSASKLSSSSSLCSQTSAPLCPGKLAGAVLSFFHPCCIPSFGLVSPETGLTVAELLLTAACSQCNPCSLQNMIPSELGAKASGRAGFYRRLINPLSAATEGTVFPSWKTSLVCFRKADLFIVQTNNYFWTIAKTDIWVTQQIRGISACE